MSEHEGARVVRRECATIVSDGLSYYKLPDGTIVGTVIIAYLEDAVHPVQNVRLTRLHTITTGTLISQVYGAPPDGTGMRSGTSGGPCRFLRHEDERAQVHVQVGGEELVSEGDVYAMEVAPTGVANCEGILTYVVDVGNGVLVDANTRATVPVGVVQDRRSAEVMAPGFLEAPVESVAVNFGSFFIEAGKGLAAPVLATAEAVVGAAEYLHQSHQALILAPTDPVAQQWVEDQGQGWTNLARGAGESAWNGVTHPLDTLAAVAHASLEMASNGWRSLHETAQRNPGAAAGELWAGMFNAVMLVKDGAQLLRAMKDWRTASGAQTGRLAFYFPEEAAAGAPLAAGGKGVRITAAATDLTEAEALAARVMAYLKVSGDEAFRARLYSDLVQVAQSPATREALDGIMARGLPLEISYPGPGTPFFDEYTRLGPRFKADGPSASALTAPLDVPRSSAPLDAYLLRGTDSIVTIAGPGGGSGGVLFYAPEAFPTAASPGTPSYVVLGHELGHAYRASCGMMCNNIVYLNQTNASGQRLGRLYLTLEEGEVIQTYENGLRATFGLPLRPNYGRPP